MVIDFKGAPDIRKKKWFFRKESQNNGEVIFVIYVRQHKHFIGGE